MAHYQIQYLQAIELDATQDTIKFSLGAFKSTVNHICSQWFLPCAEAAESFLWSHLKTE